MKRILASISNRNLFKLLDLWGAAKIMQDAAADNHCGLKVFDDALATLEEDQE